MDNSSQISIQYITQLVSLKLIPWIVIFRWIVLSLNVWTTGQVRIIYQSDICTGLQVCDWRNLSILLTFNLHCLMHFRFQLDCYFSQRSNFFLEWLRLLAYIRWQFRVIHRHCWNRQRIFLNGFSLSVQKLIYHWIIFTNAKNGV